MTFSCVWFSFFFFNDTATTEIYTLSLHDALPICPVGRDLALERPVRARVLDDLRDPVVGLADRREVGAPERVRSEEHTSELQSRQYLVCRLLLEKKNKYKLTAVSLHVNKIAKAHM